MRWGRAMKWWPSGTATQRGVRLISSEQLRNLQAKFDAASGENQELRDNSIPHGAQWGRNRRPRQPSAKPNPSQEVLSGGRLRSVLEGA